MRAVRRRTVHPWRPCRSPPTVHAAGWGSGGRAGWERGRENTRQLIFGPPTSDEANSVTCSTEFRELPRGMGGSGPGYLSWLNGVWPRALVPEHGVGVIKVQAAFPRRLRRLGAAVRPTDTASLRSCRQSRGGWVWGTPGRCRGTRTRSLPGAMWQCTGVGRIVASPSRPTSISARSASTTTSRAVTTVSPSGSGSSRSPAASAALSTLMPRTPSSPVSSRSRRPRPVGSAVP